MKIGIHDAEKEHFRHKTFPNLALMKISAWHKKQGDDVSWWEPLGTYDRVYSSKVFDFTPENPYLPRNAIRGGTGYGDIPLSMTLPDEIDAMKPDYSIYPECDFAIGYLTRGCIRQCRWCVVPQKEGKIRPYRTWSEIVREDSDKLVLMDNNILACRHGIEQLKSLAGSGYKIDANQGLDARLVTKDIAEILAENDWIRYIRFSCDQMSQLPYVKRTVELLMERGIRPYKIFIYMLVTKDLKDASRRVEALKKYRGINLYAQAERNGRLGIVPEKGQLDFAQRYVYSGSYRKETWEEYRSRHEDAKVRVREEG